MRHIAFEESTSYPVAILIKPTYLRQLELERHYLDRLDPRITRDQVIAFDLDYGGKKKVTAKVAKAYLDDLLPILKEQGCQYLYVADAEYFKALTKVTKAPPHVGYVLPCKVKGFEHMQVVLGVNYGQLVYDQNVLSRLDLTLDTLASAVDGTYKALGTNVIHYAHYPDTTQAIAAALENLHQYDELSADIETFSLHPYRAGVGTIGFAWNQHEGIAFACDYRALPREQDGLYGERVDNPQVRYHLKRFFETFKGRLRWHNASFDLRSLISALWMRHPLDYRGMIEGLEAMFRCFDDTKIIAYLATNSTAGNKLSLKELAHEHAGNYAQDEITDIRRIPLPQLLEYNLIDGLCTNYVHDTHMPTLVAENQETLYHELMLPSLKVITQMELTGMAMDPARVQEVKAELEAVEASYSVVFEDNPIIQTFEKSETERAWEADYRKRRENAKNPDKIVPKDRDSFPTQPFNPNSGPQLQRLLYEQLGLPILDWTKGKQPATGGDTLEKLVHHTEDPEVKALIEALIGLAGVSKILSSFIPAFEAAMVKDDGMAWLHGSFNLGGTVSGRLSSSDPNLQNLPSGSEYGKLVKSCFQAPPGWLMVGADFASLEDRINALLTKDPAKLKVYTDGYDGHALRAYHYWPQEFPGLRETPEDINSIKKQDHPLRQKSKTPTFALTYQGTWQTLVKNSGFSEQEAKKVETAYHNLYAVSAAWVKSQIDQAARQGYAEGAFGLRIRTPLLHRSLLGHRTTPHEAEAEARTLGNAISGQSYGLLNNRSANAFMEQVWASEFAHDILPIAQIHDAQYYLVRDHVDVVHFVNERLIPTMEWQELPEIQHPDVHLGAELDIFWPSWAQALTLPNGAGKAAIMSMCDEHQGDGDEQQAA